MGLFSSDRYTHDFKNQVVLNLRDILYYYGEAYRNNNLVPNRLENDGVAIGFKKIRSNIFSLIGKNQPYAEFAGLVVLEKELGKWGWKDKEIAEMSKIIESWPKFKRAIDEKVNAEQNHMNFDVHKDTSGPGMPITPSEGGGEISDQEDHYDIPVDFPNGDRYICRVTALPHDPLDRFGLQKGESKDSYTYTIGYENPLRAGQFNGLFTIKGFAAASVKQHIDSLYEAMTGQNPDLLISEQSKYSQNSGLTR